MSSKQQGRFNYSHYITEHEGETYYKYKVQILEYILVTKKYERVKISEFMPDNQDECMWFYSGNLANGCKSGCESHVKVVAFSPYRSLRFGRVSWNCTEPGTMGVGL